MQTSGAKQVKLYAHAHPVHAHYLPMHLALAPANDASCKGMAKLHYIASQHKAVGAFSQSGRKGCSLALCRIQVWECVDTGST